MTIKHVSLAFSFSCTLVYMACYASCSHIKCHENRTWLVKSYPIVCTNLFLNVPADLDTTYFTEVKDILIHSKIRKQSRRFCSQIRFTVASFPYMSVLKWLLCEWGGRWGKGEIVRCSKQRTFGGLGLCHDKLPPLSIRLKYSLYLFNLRGKSIHLSATLSTHVQNLMLSSNSREKR